MAYKTIETITHDYGPVNKYIDEKARLKRSKSVWGYTRSLALFLIALGVFLVLASYAYNLYKKNYTSNDESDTYSEKIEKTVDGESVVYSSEVTRFDTTYKDGYSISTGYEWAAVDDLRYGKKHVSDWCYITKNSATFYFDRLYSNQDEQLEILGLTKEEVNREYRQYCTN